MSDMTSTQNRQRSMRVSAAAVGISVLVSTQLLVKTGLRGQNTDIPI